MKLEEFEREQRQALEAAAQQVIPELDDEDEDEDDDEDLEVTLSEAMGLLEEAMSLLGFYGTIKLSHHITGNDRKAMLKLAEEIHDFVGQAKGDD